MKIQPFGIRTIKVLILILFTYYMVELLPEIHYVFFNIIIKSLVILLIYGMLIIIVKPSEDITKFLKDFWNKLKMV